MSTISKNRRLVLIMSAIPVILLIPLIAMQFSADYDWSPFDFILMGFLLLVTGLLFELVMRKVQKRDNRLALMVIVVIVFLVIWVELAVGIFGTPFAGN